MNDIFFSVIIPTYNRSDSLKRALQSLTDQTYKNFEVLVCDDGSTDQTQNVVESFKNYLNIKYLWQENWGGPAKPRNNGIHIASGDWICFLDSDDWWYANKLSTILNYLKNADIIYHDMDLYDVSLKKNNRISSRTLKSNIFKDLMINGNALINSSVAVRKSTLNTIGYLDEDKMIISSEDYDLWIRISRVSEKFVYVKKSLGGYLEDGSNISKVHLKHLNSYEAVLNKHLNDLDIIEQKEAMSMFYYVSGKQYAMVNDLETAIKLLKLALSSERYNLKIKSMIILNFYKLKYIFHNH